jgi:hypothetical protein
MDKLNMEMMTMQPIKLATYSNGLTEQQTIDLCKSNDVLSIKDLMSIPYDQIKDCLPARSKTWIQYKNGETKALIWNEGDKKKEEIDFPLKDGWYLCDKKWGIPNGEKSNSSNPEARYLWRWQDRDYNGLLVRDDYFDDGWRVVYASIGPDDCFGVLGIKPLAAPEKGAARPSTVVKGHATDSESKSLRENKKNTDNPRIDRLGHMLREDFGPKGVFDKTNEDLIMNGYNIKAKEYLMKLG